MAAIQPQSLRFKLSTVGVSLGVAFGGLATAKAVHAQDNSPGDEPDQPGMTTLDTISITTGAAPANTNEAGTGVARLPATVFETPREIQVVPAEIIKQQQAITLEETLRNVPGITLSTGEGRGGSSGDQFRIRGLAAEGDVYRDGLRDFGAFTHDMFNTESVEVFKGPSGDNFGVGNMGGLINQTSKRAHLTDETTVSGMAGTGPLGRIQIDTNRVVGENQALRFNLMGQKQDAAHRNHVESDRLGLAVDWGTGIGTGTEFHIGYSYLRERGTHDMGQPMAEGADGIYRPLLEYGVPGYSRKTSYIRDSDVNDTDVHDITAAFSHDIGNGWTLTNDTRLSYFKRERALSTPAGLPYMMTDPDDEDAQIPTDILPDLLAGIDVERAYGAGGGINYKQEGWGIQNVLAARGEFQTGSVTHEAMIGFDLSYQEDKRRRGTTSRGDTHWVVNPIYHRADYGPLTYNNPSERSTAFNAALFASDRMSFGNGWTVAGAMRLDHFKNSFNNHNYGVDDDGESLHVRSNGSATKLSPSISIIYEPNPDLMGYLSFARTYRPQGMDVLLSANLLDGQRAGALEPERADLIELGGKMNLMGGRVGLTGAIFQITKKNSYDINPDGEVAVGSGDAGQGRRIRGIEIGASGEITDAWSVYANYAYLDGKVRGGPGVSDDIIGNRAPGVPRNNASIWTSYVLPQSGVSIPGEVTLAGGIRYASKYFSNADNTAQIPETFSLDAMISYEQNDWRLALNAYNLTDHQNYSSTFSSSRAVPDSGRTFVVSVSKRF